MCIFMILLIVHLGNGALKKREAGGVILKVLRQPTLIVKQPTKEVNAAYIRKTTPIGCAIVAVASQLSCCRTLSRPKRQYANGLSARRLAFLLGTSNF